MHKERRPQEWSYSGRKKIKKEPGGEGLKPDQRAREGG